MADQDKGLQGADALESLNETLRQIAREDGDAHGLPPVERWNPERTGDIGMEIRADGSWWHEGRKIERERLVKLFSRILRRDEDGSTWLVTPYEKVVVHVEDAPFLAVRVDAVGQGREQVLLMKTNLDDRVVAGPDNPIKVREGEGTSGPQPYVLVRGRLEAKITRAVFIELADLAVEAEDDAGLMGVWSKGAFFPIGRLDGAA